MAATHTPTCNPVLITVSGSNDNTIDLANILRGDTVLIEWVSGTAVQFNTMGAVVAASATLNSTQTKMVLSVQRGDYLTCNGGAGSETFILTAL
jgi:co-chaperonin GroES (HSP10)